MSDPMAASLKLKMNANSRVLAGHPWVFANECEALLPVEHDGEVVECNFHNGAFHIPTGRVEAPPCMVPLRTYSVQVVDGKVFIEPPSA